MSMGANAATKVYRIVDNLEKIIGVELLNAAQGLAFRAPLKSSEMITDFIAEYRKTVDFVEDDVEMHPLMEKSIQFVKDFSSALSTQDFL